jgi:hypothetical protein
MNKSILIMTTLLLTDCASAQDERLIVYAEITSVTNTRYTDDEHVTELEDGTLLMSNACGRYTARARVKEVLVGSIQEPEIEISGIIGEWCEPVLNIFPDSHVFELTKTSDGYENIAHITLYELEDESLAASALWLDFPAEDISDVEFAYYYSEGLTYSEEDLEQYWKDVDRSWFREQDGQQLLVKGVKYEDLRSLIITNKSLPE